ncbi:amidohydrolase family protein [Halorussus litoreus]|uniref:amidohydrolase family protein n=1 Tax=Halorussus litoreus TaxID=1710536 RepID=UPI000E2757AE|nr:amidohydrolase family protein [Halorussus litoreus]
MTIREMVAEIELVDNHAHPVMELPREKITEEFPTFFTEGDLPAEDARHTVHYRRALRLLDDRLDGETEAELLASRADVDLEDYSQDLIGETGTGVILADDGFPETTPEEFEAYTDARVEPLLRLEPVVEELVPDHEDLDSLVDAFEERVETALDGGYVGLKSIAAYRSGLDVAPPDEAAATARSAYDDVRAAFDGRLADASVIEHCLHRATDVAADYDVPVQLHTGFGDRDAHPRYVDPTYLADYLDAHLDTAVVLLHAGYPYVRAAGYVTSTFPNAYLDLSLANPFVQHGVEPMFRQAMEAVPVTKLLYGSDAFTIPELYVLAAERAREDLASVLEELVDDGYYTTDYAKDVARMILRENAMELYDLAE